MTESWRESARCREIGPEFFFAEHKGESMSEAKSVCSRCEVRDECLEFAISKSMAFGVWGGLSPKQRRDEQARRNRERRDAA
jgi:WhiB family redox-sensing transcriptional regulator